MEREEVDKRYLNRNKVLCRFAGVWPYQSNISKHIVRTFPYALGLSSMYTQFARIVVFFSPDILIEQCAFLLAVFGIFMKLVNYSVNHEKLHGLVNGIYSDWGINRPPAETEIMDVYGKRGVLITLAYLSTAMFGTISFIFVPTAVGIMEYFARTGNGTVQRYYVYPAYYPFDEDKYFIYFWTHMVLVVVAIAIVYSACDSLYMFSVQHACGLLAVAGYRFKSAIETHAHDEKETVKTMDMVYQKVCFSIRGHKRALRFIQDIHELHSTYLAVSVVVIITAFSVTLVKTSITEIGVEFYKYFGFLVVQLIHLFFLTSQGQFVQNAYDQVYNEMYEGQWYNCSRKTQMLYLLALRGALTAPVLSAGGLLPLTLETFAEVLKASVSYFTVLKSQ